MSRRQSAICFRVVLIPFLTGFAPSVFALANRVFVSARSGNDANTCDNILAPCQTFAGAVTKLNPGGEAIVLDSGGYGAVTITQALTIEAPPGVLAFIHPSSGDAVTVNAPGATVTLRGLVMNVGPSNGIEVQAVGTLNVENCSITGFVNFGIDMAVGGTLNLKSTDVKGCFVGVDIHNTSGAVRASIDHCHLDGNGAGFRAHATSPGESRTTATNSTANSNDAGWICGIVGSTGLDILNVEFCSGSGNTFHGLVMAGDNASSASRVSNGVFSNNGQFGLARQGAGALQTRGNNTATGNGISATSGTITSFSPI